MSASTNLSPQEDRVFAFNAAGLSHKEIAHRLAIGMGSVAQLMDRIKTKLGVRSAIKLALLWHGCDTGAAITFAEQLRPAGRDKTPSQENANV
jgi:DNA-binding NarL/FixJ family response regulator